MCRELVDQCFQVLDRCCHDLHDERIATRHTITFQYLGNTLGKSSKAATPLSRKGTHANNSRDGKTDLGPIDLGMIAADNTSVFHFPNPLRDGGCRESNPLSQLSVSKPGILLAGLQDGPSRSFSPYF